MKNLKKYVALGLIGTMVLGSSITAFAGDGDATEATAVNVEGTGANVAISTEVYSVTLPTAETMAKLFDYDVDPQGLVGATAGARYGSNITVGDNTGVLFPNYDETLANVTGVSDTSDALVITNKSSKGIKLSITCKLDGTGTYAGDYSSTPDFSGTGDSAKGLYFGIRQSGDLEKSFDETGIGGVATAVTNAAKSSADQYVTKATASTAGAATSYTYVLKDGAEDFATYKFYVTGQLNDEVAESTWYTVSNHAVTGKTFKPIKLTFTPSLISATDAYDKAGEAILNLTDGTLYLGKAGGLAAGDGGFAEDTKALAVTINEKATTVATPAGDNVLGFTQVSWTEVLSTFGYSGDEYAISTDKGKELLQKINTVTFTYNGEKYYADVKAMTL
jgi:hypothetical protein